MVNGKWVNWVAGGGKRVAMATMEILDRKCRRGDRERGKAGVKSGVVR